MQAQLGASCSSQDGPWIQALPEREHRSLKALQIVHGDMESVDTNPSLDRMSPTTDGKLNTILPDNRVVLFKKFVPRPRVLAGVECLALQGFPAPLAETVANQDEDSEPDQFDGLFRDLAGNAYSGPVFGAFLLSFLKHMPKFAFDFCERWARSHGSQGQESIEVKDLLSAVVEDIEWAGA